MTDRALTVKVRIMDVDAFAGLVRDVCNLVNALAPTEAAVLALPSAVVGPLGAVQTGLRALGQDAHTQ